MNMRRVTYVLLVTVAATIGAVTSCTLDGENNWWVDLNVIDTDRGLFYAANTTDIQGIQSATHSGDGLNAGPYFVASFSDSAFSLALSDAFASYEENETSMSMSISVTFTCTSGNTANYVFITTITDTNNNAPVFTPSDVITVAVTPPLAPGVSLTGCENDALLVRDIDLTTQRIEFNIEENDYFEIAYDAASSGGKSFGAVLRTKAFIRSLTGPISLTITATDVDLTGDPARTSSATLVVDPDTSYQLPDEPRWSRAYYVWTDGATADEIRLEQGYDDLVNFTLSGEYAEYFQLALNGSAVSLATASPLPAAAPAPLYLVLAAERRDTSGALATVVVELPNFTEIRFAQPHYEGYVVDNVLNVSQLTLEQGYENGFTVNILNEHAQYFSYTILDNTVTLSMTPLDSEIIDSNSVLVLQVVAANEATSTVAVVTLEIVKGDVSAPAFAQNIYIGAYGEAGLDLSDIILSEGYDDTVTFALEGEYNELFTLSHNGNAVTLGVNSTLPAEVLQSEQFILLALTASKTGANSANTAVSISLPTARELSFERPSYRGSSDGTSLSLPPVTLAAGFGADVYFTLSGDLASYFILTNEGNEVSIELSTSLPEEVLADNNNILLTIAANGTNVVPAVTVLIIDLIKNDTEIPVFSQAIYYANYEDGNQLIFGNGIVLSQGYDTTVSFVLDGESSTYFAITNNNSNVIMTLQSNIPEDIIYEEKFLVFTVLARKPLTTDANAAVVVTFPQELTESTVMRFTKSAYTGSLRGGTLNVEDMVLGTGYATGTEFALDGDLSSYFTLNVTENVVSISLTNSIPTEAMQSNPIILEITANRERSISATSGVVIQVDAESAIPVFSAAYYRGTYSIDNGLQFNDTIYLLEGFDDSVTFALAGDDSQYFSLDVNGNQVTINLSSTIPQEVALNYRQLLFSIVASTLQPQSATAVSIDLLDYTTDIMSFSEILYTGAVSDGALEISEIRLSRGYSNDVTFDITGELSEYFEVTNDGDLVSLQMSPELTLETLVDTDVLVFTLVARTETSSAQTVIVLNIINNSTTENRILVFEEAYYVGEYSDADGLSFSHQMQLVEGHDESLQYYLEGENSQLFTLVQTENSFTLALSGDIPAETLNNNRNFVFAIVASAPEGYTASAAVVIAVDYQINSETIVLQFESRSYEGTAENGVLDLPSISLTQGYNENVTFVLEGDLSNYFTLTNNVNNVSIEIETEIPTNNIPENGIIILGVQAVAPNAISAYATLIINVDLGVNVTNDTNVAFEKVYYVGAYTEEDGFSFVDTITLSEGYSDDVTFSLVGENSDWFSIEQNGNTVSLVTSVDLTSGTDAGHVLFSIVASRPGARDAGAAIFVSIERDASIGSNVSFESGLYSGSVRDGIVQHQAINLVGYNGSEILLYGQYAAIFSAEHTEGAVSLSAAASISLPENTTFVALELAADAARTALVLAVDDTEPQSPPTVSFSSPSYELRAEAAHSGVLGRVAAAADSGEPVEYSLLIDDEHLQQRLSVMADGSVYLSSPAQPGAYSCEVVATAAVSRATAIAEIRLRVYASSSCGTDVVAPPLLVLRRDEEAEHRDLLTLQEGCTYSLSNRWPAAQRWLYVDDAGLHATAIDREDDSIAFMTLSQIQVELTIQCANDTSTRQKRSLGEYDYGGMEWVLTQSIAFDSRRTLVTLIVDDINDNYPVFAGKEREPLALGWPVDELLDVVRPRALVQLHATDRDVGENAALLYWSAAPELAVSATGLVHVRDNARLHDNTRTTVHATDRRGDGLSGDLDLLVRLVNSEHIAVITVRNSFLEDEDSVLALLTAELGYEVKALSSSMISDEYSEANRRKRQTTAGTASMRLYIYGLRETEPVNVNDLLSDLGANTISGVAIAESISLRDYLERVEIVIVGSGRDTGLLVATIVLSILLLMLIIAIALWIFLKRQGRNYEEFSDANSLASRNESVSVAAAAAAAAKPRPPRVDIDELKRSERRLQELLSAPIEQVTVETQRAELRPVEPAPITCVPIVIQSIDKLKGPALDTDDEDEFGEVKVTERRKSVVTFNENVEKIIHIDDGIDADVMVERF